MKPKKTCPQCSGPRTYFDKYDVFACTACDIWLEPPCKCTPADYCPFAPTPSKPSEAT